MNTLFMTFEALTLVGILIMVSKKVFWPEVTTLDRFNETRVP